MSLDVQAAVGCGVLARIGTLTLNHQRREAQALWDWARAGEVQLRTEPAAPDSPAAALREAATLQRARLFLREDSDDGYQAGRAMLDEIYGRVGPDADRPTLTGERRRRILMQLSTSYSFAGQEESAMRLTQFQLAPGDVGWRDTDRDRLRAATAHMPPIRAADHLHNQAVRLTRLAFLESLAGPERTVTAQRYLDRARISAAVAAEKRRSRHGVLAARWSTVRVELEACSWIDDHDERRAALDRVADEARAIVVDSNAAPETSPSIMLARQALHGSAMAELARCDGLSHAASAAQLARIGLAHTVRSHQVDAHYAIAPLVRYADASAVIGDKASAVRYWRLAHRRLLRSRPGHPALGAIEQRLEVGMPPLW